MNGKSLELISRFFKIRLNKSHIDWLLSTQAVSKRTKKSSDLKFTPLAYEKITRY